MQVVVRCLTRLFCASECEERRHNTDVVFHTQILLYKHSVITSSGTRPQLEQVYRPLDGTVERYAVASHYLDSSTLIVRWDRQTHQTVALHYPTDNLLRLGSQTENANFINFKNS